MIKKIYSIFICSFFFVSSLLCYQYQLSIGMIFKDEAPYLKEWIEYHRLVGVEHFYLFNDGSTDEYKKVLAPYIKKGIVELSDAITQPDFNGTQVDCYNRTLIATRGISKWVAMIDSDEFLVTPKGIKIIDVLNEFESPAGVVINWLCFGTSNVSKIPPEKLMIESLTHCAPPEHNINLSKTIVRPERVCWYNNPHWPELVPGLFLVDGDGIFYSPGAHIYKMNKLWINHYWTRDEEFFINVKIPRSIPWGRDPQAMLQTAQEFNLSTNDCILRHVPRLKKRVFSKRTRK